MKDLFNKHLSLPLKLLFLEPIVFLITIYTAFIYGILYLFLEAYPIVFAEKRGINEAVATLPYIGLIIGVIVGSAIVIAFEPRYNRKLRANNNIPVSRFLILEVTHASDFGCPLFSALKNISRDMNHLNNTDYPNRFRNSDSCQ